jgi:transcriptional regulator with XRE-family HTH domain
MKIHIGKLILEKLKERGISKSEFARKVNKSRQNVQDVFKRESVDTQLLAEIGEVLDFDFFSVLSETSLSSKKDIKIRELTRELKKANKEIHDLKRVNTLLLKDQ